MERLTTTMSALSMSNKIHFIAPVAAGIAVAAGITTVWFSGTPRYAAFQMGRAIETGNAQKALQYVDSDALASGVVEMAISVVKQKALTQIQTNQNNWETFGTALGVSLIDNIKEPLKNQLETQLTSEITKAASQKPSGVAFKLLTSDIKQEDSDSAAIAFQLPENYQGPLPLDEKMTLQLEKRNGRWQLVGLDKPTLEMLARSGLKNQQRPGGEVEQTTYPDVASSSPQPQTESVPTNEAEESAAEIASPPSVASSEVVLTANDANARINLRETPSANGKYLGYGLIGDRVQAIDQTTADGYTWYKVQFPKSGAQGWIRGDFISQP
jgi:hypothetical protein